MAGFVDKIAQRRQFAHDNGKAAMSTVYKLINNASYGRLGMNLSKLGIVFC